MLNTSASNCQSGAKLHAAATDHMAQVEANPDRVKSYFPDPRVMYAVKA